MDVDNEARVFRLLPEEVTALKLSEDIPNPISFDDAEVLLSAAEASLAAAHAFDPSSLPHGTRKFEMVAAQAQRAQLAGNIINQVTPMVETTIADDFEQYLSGF